MQHIIVNDEQAQIISDATQGVEIRDQQGRHLGYVAHGFTDEDIGIAKQRLASDERRYTTTEVMDHLKSLEDKMTRYTVVWPESALDELAEIWLKSEDRSTVTSAAAAIDRELADDALQKGLELSEGLRAFYAVPLRVLFTVRDDDRIVEVLRIKRH